MSRDIVIYPNRGTTGSTDQPYISFSGASAGTITLVVEDDGSLTFDGDTGSLFGISDSKDGLLHSVNDVSGLPIFQVYDNDYLYMGKWDEPTLIVSGQSWNIIGGSGHTVNSGVTKSVILGGEGITATTSDTVYVDNLNIRTLGGGASINNLGIDSNGMVVTGSTGGSGSVGGTGTTNTITKWSSTTGLTDSQITDNGTTVTITGNTTISGVTQVNGNETIRKKSFQTLTSGATVTWNMNSGLNAEVTLGGNSTLDITNVEDGDYGTLVVIQDSIGSRTLALDGTFTNRVSNGGGGSVLLTSTANAHDIVTFVYNGNTNTMYWNVGNDYN